MNYTYENSRGSLSIDKKRAFAALFNSNDVFHCEDIRALLNRVDSAILNEHQHISQGSLNNCHGDWYEWLVAINAWNYSFNNSKNLLLWLPNKSTLDISDLYKSELKSLIEDLEYKVREATSVNLITSNPDFVILNREKIEIPEELNTNISEINSPVLDTVENAYQFYLGKCSFHDIVGYLSIKTSFRPDRRIQISHEGSLMKAIYTHLQTRNWIINPPGLKYYAGAIQINDADRESMKTVATHSITTVHSTPQSAVDEVFTLDTTSAIEEMFVEILE